MYSSLSIWVLFILLMQLANGAQFLNTAFFAALFAAAPAAAVLLTYMFPLANMYASP